MATISFAVNIMPYFKQYKAAMMWRFDITNYDVVKANASIIYNRIANVEGAGYMPPPEFSPLPQNVIDNFKTWMDQGCPP